MIILRLMAGCRSSPEQYIDSEPLAKLPVIAFPVNDPDRLDPRVALRATKRPLSTVMAYSTHR
jgi:hypothetical protein